MAQIYLASSSPRRADLLRQIGISFEVVVPNVEETPLEGELPDTYARRISAVKARHVESHAAPHLPVLAADTVVVLQGGLMGKPRDRDDGLEMLALLSGNTHQVISAVSVCQGDLLQTVASETLVRFRKLTKDEREKYWQTGEPRDKAGGYGIQGLGAVFVESINGSYSGVVGLPLMQTAELLRRFGVDCLP
jgi:septum formation protein|tara:strand:+ start:820 stop:1395 length:576 start_codon:yes stop_codon:yes gene_type:complete